MRLLTFVLPMLVMALLFSSESIAQTNYTPPSPELVERLLNELESCKAIQKEAEADLKFMEANANDYTLADYIEVRNLINRAQSCINSRRAQLEELRKDYPGWFNSPNATMTINFHGRRTITPRQLENMLAQVENKIAAVLARFEKIPRPEN
ncbi:MAG: hypothetical protein AAF466_14035 [Bacteroidota bacterium]